MELGRIHKRKLCNPNGHLETVTIVNGEGNEATQSSYGFVSFLSTYGPGMKKLPEICKWTPQLIDIVQPPLKRLINPMNGDNETQVNLCN
ncbi:hypothetical protein AB3S75_019716 [Citrus x aurantiifolia]